MAKNINAKETAAMVMKQNNNGQCENWGAEKKILFCELPLHIWVRPKITHGECVLHFEATLSFAMTSLLRTNPPSDSLSILSRQGDFYV